MSIIIDNITSLMKSKHWNAYDLQEASQVPQSTIHRMLSGKHRDPRTSTIQKIAKGLGVTELHLRTNIEGEDPTKKRLHQNTQTVIRIPVLLLKNIGIFLAQDNDEQEFIIMTTNMLNASDSTFAVKITSNNFKPYVQTGETIVVDPESQVQSGQGIIVEINGEYHIMTYQKTLQAYAKPMQDGLPAILLSDEVKMIGAIVWIITVGRKG